MSVFVSNSVAETERYAASLGEKLLPNTTIALFGGMGMGKTAFARGLAKGLGYEGEVSSPTFAIVHEYRGGRLPMYHFDMYRVTDWDSLYSTNFFEYCESGGVCLVEWSENIENALPEGYIKITLCQGDNENSRIITMEEA